MWKNTLVVGDIALLGNACLCFKNGGLKIAHPFTGAMIEWTHSFYFAAIFSRSNSFSAMTECRFCSKIGHSLCLAGMTVMGPDADCPLVGSMKEKADDQTKKKLTLR